ncbi:MAG: MFS transporter, partial [Acidimicrobiaceae bacterium]|nr:MFS transporter [Acidimicrobiaceae bacterium]
MSFVSSARFPDRPSVLRNRDFAVATVARAVSVFGDQLAVIVLVLRLHNLGGGAWGVAGVLAAGTLPGVLLSPVAGLLADRWDSRALLLAGSVVQALVCVLLAFSGPVAVVLALVGVLSAVEAVVSATWQALVPRIVGEDQIPAALGLGRTATTAASLVAPAAGGVLAAAYGSRVPLLIDAATYLAVLGAAIAVRTRRHIVADSRTRSRMWDGLAFVRSDRVARPLLTSLIVFVVVGGTVNVVDVFLVRDTLGASDAWYGAIVALWLAGMVAGSLLAGRRRGEPALTRAALGGAATIALALGAIAAVPSVGWLVPLELAGGIGNGML